MATNSFTWNSDRSNNNVGQRLRRIKVTPNEIEYAWYRNALMKLIDLDRQGSLIIITLFRGKVNAINPKMVEELRSQLEKLEADPETKAVILTGAGKFFSFGFDLPEMIDWPRDKFGEFIHRFCDLLTYMFLYPKPLIAAINGHATGGGCMLALACDYRIMVTGNAKIALNEVTFGASVFAGSTEMLRFWTGSANAWKILSTGAMLLAEEAQSMGLVQEVVAESDLAAVTQRIATEMGEKPQAALAHLKLLLRRRIVEEFAKHEDRAIEEWLDIWYSPETQALAKSKVVIRS